MSHEENSLRVLCGEEIKVDTLADQFESAWKAGQSPRIEDFLERLDESARPAAFRELLNVEIELRRDQQEKVNSDDYLFRFPGYTSVIREVIEQVDRLLPTVACEVGKGRSGPKVRCPSCHEPIEVAADTDFTRITCSTCGIRFSLVDQSQSDHAAPPATMMGRFELIERVGVGGFGSVWKAIDKELDRIVAIKVPRHVAATADEQERFFREARAAAQLRHPNIVSVHEAGRDGDSVYIVSDFVFGVTLGDWLTTQQLTSREAAELCAKIAMALHHAHEGGVIHRDLKPANVMIDRHGEPHIMDFGLARREVGEVTVTRENQVFGTLAYMSPEQARGEGHAADRRSDVYSLGVILFQLLTGERPFRGNERMLLDQVINDEPPSPRKLNAHIPKDLETITLKCLEKERARRYPSAFELASDLRRFLADEPIEARPIGRRERMAKWVRRNKAVSASLSAVALALVSGTVVSTYFAIEAHRNAAVAVSKQREAEEVTGFLVNAFQSPDPARDGRTVTVAEVLDRAEKDALEELANQPLTQAALLMAIGSSRMGLGLYLESVEPLLNAMKLRREILGRNHVDTLQSINLLAVAHFRAGRNLQAISFFEQALAGQQVRLGMDHPDTLHSMNNLASAYAIAGRLGDAIELLERTLTARGKILGADHPDTLIAMNNLAVAYEDAGKPEDAIPLHEQALAVRRKKLGENHPDTLGSLNNLGLAYVSVGRTNEAIPLHEQALVARREKLGADHPDTLGSLNDLALAYASAGLTKEAIQLHQQALAARREKLGSDHPATLRSMNNLASAYLLAGHTEDAITLHEQTLVARRDKLGAEHPTTLTSISSLALAYDNVGRTKESIPLHEQALAARREKLGADHPDTLTSLNNLGLAYNNAGRTKEAILLHEQAVVGWRTKHGADHPNTLASLHNLALAYVSARRTDEAISLHEQALVGRREKLGANHPDTLQSMNSLAMAYCGAGRPDDAIRLLEQGLAARREKLGGEHLDTLHSMNNLAFAYYSAGRIKDALPLYESAVEIRREIFPDHPDTRRLMNDLAYAYYSLGRREDAISLYETALAAQRGNPGVHHPDTLRTMHNLAKAYDSAGRIQDAIQLWLECGAYFEALLSARHAENELMSSLVESSVAQDVDEVRLPRDRAVVGELRLVGGHPESAEAAIRAGIDGLDNAPASMYKSLGVVLIAQGKSDEATKAFRTALARTRQDDGTFKLEGADIVEMTAAYFLDLISQDEYVASMAESKADACVPWFYVGQRMEFGGDREAALAAYKRSVELGDEETADATRRLARWRLTELQKRVE